MCNLDFVPQQLEKQMTTQTQMHTHTYTYTHHTQVDGKGAPLLTTGVEVFLLDVEISCGDCLRSESVEESHCRSRGYTHWEGAPVEGEGGGGGGVGREVDRE